MQPFGPPSHDVRDLRELDQWSFPMCQRAHRAGEEHPRRRGAHQRPERLRWDATHGIAHGWARCSLTTEQSFCQDEDAIRHCRETLEDLFQLRHAIWIRALEQQETGLEAPSVFVETLTARDIQLQNGRITAETLRGTFRASRAVRWRRRTDAPAADFNGFLTGPRGAGRRRCQASRSAPEPGGHAVGVGAGVAGVSHPGPAGVGWRR